MHKHMNRRAKSTFAASNSSGSGNNNNNQSSNNNSSLKWKGCKQSGRQAARQKGR